MRAGECCLMGSIFTAHARAQSSTVELRFDLIADIDARSVRDERAVRGTRDDRKAACQSGQGTDRIQSALRETQAMLGTRQTREERVAQASFSENHFVIRVFAPDWADQSFGVAILTWRSRREGSVANAHGAKPPFG